MITTAVGQCPHCAAVINRHWMSCLVCHAILSPTAQTGQTGSTSLAVPLPTIQPGSLIEWTRADGSVLEGIVGLIHLDDTGTRWAFVTIGENWAVVNLNLLKGPTV